jgi:hypothetical protein
MHRGTARWRNASTTGACREVGAKNGARSGRRPELDLSGSPALRRSRLATQLAGHAGNRGAARRSWDGISPGGEPHTESPIVSARLARVDRRRAPAEFVGVFKGPPRPNASLQLRQACRSPRTRLNPKENRTFKYEGPQPAGRLVHPRLRQYDDPRSILRNRGQSSSPGSRRTR